MQSSKPVDEKLVERRKEGVHPGKVSNSRLCHRPCTWWAGGAHSTLQRLSDHQHTTGHWANPANPARLTRPSKQVMRVVDGRHSGLLCEVVALEPQEEGRSGGHAEPPCCSLALGAWIRNARADWAGWRRKGGQAGSLLLQLPSGLVGSAVNFSWALFGWGEPSAQLACLCPHRLPVARLGLTPPTITHPPTLTPPHRAADRARVRLLPSYETVTVRCKELGEREERTREEREREKARERGGSRGGERERDRGGERSGRSSRGEEGGREERHRHKRGARWGGGVWGVCLRGSRVGWCTEAEVGLSCRGGPPPAVHIQHCASQHACIRGLALLCCTKRPPATFRFCI